jgi:hypothetical protein
MMSTNNSTDPNPTETIGGQKSGKQQKQSKQCDHCKKYIDNKKFIAHLKEAHPLSEKEVAVRKASKSTKGGAAPRGAKSSNLIGESLKDSDAQAAGAKDAAKDKIREWKDKYTDLKAKTSGLKGDISEKEDQVKLVAATKQLRSALNAESDPNPGGIGLPHDDIINYHPDDDVLPFEDRYERLVVGQVNSTDVPESVFNLSIFTRCMWYLFFINMVWTTYDLLVFPEYRNPCKRKFWDDGAEILFTMPPMCDGPPLVLFNGLEQMIHPYILYIIWFVYLFVRTLPMKIVTIGIIFDNPLIMFIAWISGNLSTWSFVFLPIVHMARCFWFVIVCGTALSALSYSIWPIYCLYTRIAALPLLPWFGFAARREARKRWRIIRDCGIKPNGMWIYLFAVPVETIKSTLLVAIRTCEGLRCGPVFNNTDDNRPLFDRAERKARQKAATYTLYVEVRTDQGYRYYRYWPQLPEHWKKQIGGKLRSVDLDLALLPTLLNRRTLVAKSDNPELAFEMALRLMSASPAYQEDYNRLLHEGRSLYRDMALVAGTIVTKSVYHNNLHF